jgi:hypothetical protein
MLRNLLTYGDNRPVLRERVPDDSVELIYLGPPFKSGQDYKILFRERTGGSRRRPDPGAWTINDGLQGARPCLGCWPN